MIKDLLNLYHQVKSEIKADSQTETVANKYEILLAIYFYHLKITNVKKSSHNVNDIQKVLDIKIKDIKMMNVLLAIWLNYNQVNDAKKQLNIPNDWNKNIKINDRINSIINHLFHLYEINYMTPLRNEFQETNLQWLKEEIEKVNNTGEIINLPNIVNDIYVLEVKSFNDLIKSFDKSLITNETFINTEYKAPLLVVDMIAYCSKETIHQWLNIIPKKSWEIISDKPIPVRTTATTTTVVTAYDPIYMREYYRVRKAEKYKIKIRIQCEASKLGMTYGEYRRQFYPNFTFRDEKVKFSLGSAKHSSKAGKKQEKLKNESELETENSELQAVLNAYLTIPI